MRERRLAPVAFALALAALLGPMLYVSPKISAGESWRADLMPACLLGVGVSILATIVARRARQAFARTGGDSRWATAGAHLATVAGGLWSLVMFVDLFAPASEQYGSQWYLHPIGGNFVAVAIALALLAIAFVAGLVFRRVTPRQQTVLILLRLAIFALVVAAMLRPTRVFTEVVRQPATLLILADASRSMLVADGLGGATRWDNLQNVLRESQSSLEALAEAGIDVKLYTFGAELQPAEWRQSLQLGSAAGSQTAMGATLEEALRREGNQRLAGVLMLSDGAHQASAPYDLPPETPVRRMADLGYPLYTFAFGQPTSAGQARDLALRELLVSPTVFVKNKLPVRATAVLQGAVNEDVAAQLLFEKSPGEMEPVAVETLRAARDGEQLSINMEFEPQTAGEHKLTVRLPPLGRELVTSNNELSTFVTVLKGGLKVLYLEGKPRVEQRFLRRSLNASPDIKVDFQWFDQRNRTTWPVDLSEQFKPGQYDVYILGDLDSSVFRTEDLTQLRSTVQAGAGLVMLGGLNSFWGGGYQQTPLADVLPVEADRLQRDVRQEFDQPVRRDLHLDGPIQMLPNRRFGAMPLMMLAEPAKNAEAWQALPPLEGANRLMPRRGTAKVLAETPAGEALLVADEPGTGRVLAFAGDSTWHWWMQGFDAQHRRFWRQVVLWLAKKEEATEGNVWVRLEQRRFTPGRRVEFNVGAQTPQGEAIMDAQYEAVVLLPDGTRRPVSLSRSGELMAGALTDTVAPGDYTVQVRASREGESLGTGQARFLVYEQDLELDNAAARPTYLAHLSKLTEDAGGQALAAEQLPDLLEELRQRPPDLEVATQTKQTPWDTPWFFLLLVGCLVTEWYLRKRWGLV